MLSLLRFSCAENRPEVNLKAEKTKNPAESKDTMKIIHQKAARPPELAKNIIRANKNRHREPPARKKSLLLAMS